MVSVEKLQETCLSSCRSLDAAERKFCYFAVDTLEVSLLGYVSERRAVQRGRFEQIDFTLQEEDLHIAEVVITPACIKGEGKSEYVLMRELPAADEPAALPDAKN